MTIKGYTECAKAGSVYLLFRQITPNFGKQQLKKADSDSIICNCITIAAFNC